MENSLNVWQHYRPGFIHPEYAPYIRAPVTDKDGNVIMVNNWKRMDVPNGLTYPELVRAGWGMRFVNPHPDDPCPHGFQKKNPDGINDGYCYRQEPEYEPVFYTDKAFVTKVQFLDGYADHSAARGVPQRVSSSFDMRSVSPLDGNFAIYHQSTPARATTKYGMLNSRDSYLA